MEISGVSRIPPPERVAFVPGERSQQRYEHSPKLQGQPLQRTKEAESNDSGFVSEEQVIHAIEKANKKFETYDTRLEFTIHEKTHEIMIKVIRDDEIIREIPPEKILDMVANMMEMAGLLVDKKA